MSVDGQLGACSAVRHLRVSRLFNCTDISIPFLLLSRSLFVVVVFLVFVYNVAEVHFNALHFHLVAVRVISLLALASQ